MRAALVTSFDTPPHLAEVPSPIASGDQELVTVLASALHPRVRSQADGSHYSTTGDLPLIPGVDGVARDAEGTLRYFVVESGAMAEQIVIDPRRSVALPGDVDPVVVAAAMNPAMSSWIALRHRVDLTPGSRVLIMGATGNAGRMAVQVARRLGAGHIAAAGRDPGRLAELGDLGADAVVDLGRDPEEVRRDLAAVGRDVDVVLDYLWGPWAAATLRAVVPAREDDAQPLTWIQIGSVTGPESPIPSAALRACNLRIVGSGQGSVPPRDILADLPGLAAEVMTGGYAIDAHAVPLADVAEAWERSRTTRARLVLTP